MVLILPSKKYWPIIRHYNVSIHTFSALHFDFAFQMAIFTGPEIRSKITAVVKKDSPNHKILLKIFFVNFSLVRGHKTPFIFCDYS